MKTFIKKILFPNKLVGFVSFNLGFILLIYVFNNHLEETLLAYISYILLSYALVIFCIWFYRVCKLSNDTLKKSKIYRLYKQKSIIVTRTSMYSSFIFNLTYGIFKLGIGIYYKSWWFLTFAVYYLLLCFMKLSVAKNIDDRKREYMILKRTGIALLFLNLILTGIIILIIKQNRIIHYSGFLIYLVALYDFYQIIAAIINVVKYRKNHNPIVASSKCINLAVAMISMVSLEVALIYQFGNNDPNFKSLMTAAMGLAICLIDSFMGIYMILKANKSMR